MPFRATPKFLLSLIVGAAALAGCASNPPEPEGAPRKEFVLAVTQDHELIRFNAGQPRKVLERKPLRGLPAGDSLVGIDFRIAKGVLYGLSRQGLLFTIDPASGQLTRVGNKPLALALEGERFGFDFNPAADRIRVVSGSFNLRLHPDSGEAVDGDANTPGVQPDGRLAYNAADVNQGRTPDVVAAGYTYNKQDEKITTNYAIDRALGVLVIQGSKEGVQPVVSPNTGRLTTVGGLGTGAVADASLDIADVSGLALASLRVAADGPTRLYQVDLSSGKAQLIGTIAGGGALRGLAIEP